MLKVVAICDFWLDGNFFPKGRIFMADYERALVLKLQERVELIPEENASDFGAGFAKGVKPAKKKFEGELEDTKPGHDEKAKSKDI